MRREVTREEFLEHLQRLIVNETDEPCTIVTPFPIVDITNEGQSAGVATISYFPEWTPDWLLREYPDIERSRHVECNHSGAGLRYRVSLPQFNGYARELLVIEEEESIALRRGVELQYVIGQKVDRYGMGKRGDPPGTDFDIY